MMTTAEAPAATTVDPALLADAVAAVQAAHREVNSVVIESRDLVHILFLAVLGRVNAFVSGEGGIGKSYAARLVMDHLPGEFWATQFSKDMTRDELFGPPDIGALQNGRFERDIAGMFCEAHMVLADEFSDASTMIARSLLNALNEKKMRDGRRVIELPLWSMIATGNFWIEAPELAALFDRLALRLVHQGVTSSQGRMAIWRGQIERNANGGQSVGPVTKVTLDQLTLLHHAVATCTVPQDILTTIDQLLSKVTAAGITLSNRRIGEGLKVAQAHAVLNGRTHVSEEDLMTFRWVLPNHPDEFAKCAELTAEFAGKVANAVEGLTASFQDARSAHDTEDSDTGATRHVMGIDDMRAAIAAGAGTDPDRMTTITADIGPMSARLKEVKHEVEAKRKELAGEGRDVSELDALLNGIHSDQSFLNEVIFG